MAINSIEIEGKVYELYYGAEFLKYLDIHEGTSLSVDGFKLDKKMLGLELTLELIQQLRDSVLLEQYLKAAMVTLKSKPSNSQLSKFVEELLESGTEEDPDKAYDEFFDEFIETVKKKPRTGQRLRNFQKMQGR